jgi:hypothetical protein
MSGAASIAPARGVGAIPINCRADHLVERRDSDAMAIGIPKFVASVAEFISRFWPIGKSEEAVLEEQRLRYRSDPQARDSFEDDRT